MSIFENFKIGEMGRPLIKCLLKTREEMVKDIPSLDLGWWYDICPGQELVLTTATKEDCERCVGTGGHDPNVYLVEDFPKGALILKEAIKEMAVIIKME